MNQQRQQQMMVQQQQFAAMAAQQQQQQQQQQQPQQQQAAQQIGQSCHISVWLYSYTCTGNNRYCSPTPFRPSDRALCRSRPLVARITVD